MSSTVMSDRNPFKARLASGQTQVGTFTGLANTALHEILAARGLDFLLVDLEHGEIGISDLAGILAATERAGAEALVRVPWNDRVWIKRAMDMGARSIMVPQVENAEEAAQAVSYMRYPPHGVRGVAHLNRGGRFGTVKDYLPTAFEEACLVVQMESEQAFGQLDAIVKVEGVDAVFLGPSDLAASMNLVGQNGHERVQAMLDEAVAICRAAGKPVATVSGSPEQAASLFGKGYSFLTVGGDGDFLAKAVDACVSGLGKWRARSG